MAKIKTRRKMGWILIAFHSTMILMTVGLWTPIYLAARRRRVTVTHVPDNFNAPLPPRR
jgi:hypothetical protein